MYFSLASVGSSGKSTPGRSCAGRWGPLCSGAVESGLRNIGGRANVQEMRIGEGLGYFNVQARLDLMRRFRASMDIVASATRQHRLNE